MCTAWPRRASSPATVRPPGPAPTTATVLPVGGDLRRLEVEVGGGPVGDEALEPADGDRIALLAAHADAFALHLLRADPAGGRRQGVVGEQHLGRAGEVARRDALEKVGDAHLDRAAADAGSVLALDAALRFEHGKLGGQAQVDLGEVVAALLGVLLGHGDAGDVHALLGAQRGGRGVGSGGDGKGGGGDGREDGGGRGGGGRGGRRGGGGRGGSRSRGGLGRGGARDDLAVGID